MTNESYTVTIEYLCTVSNEAGTVTNELSTVMAIDIVIQQVMEFVGMGIGNRYTPLLLCENCGDILVYLICPMLGKFQWMVVQNVD